MAHPFADLALARRLELVEAQANVNVAFVEARARLFPESGAAWMEAAGARAMFDRVWSPVTHAAVVLESRGVVCFVAELDGGPIATGAMSSRVASRSSRARAGFPMDVGRARSSRCSRPISAMPSRKAAIWQ